MSYIKSTDFFKAQKLRDRSKSVNVFSLIDSESSSMEFACNPKMGLRKTKSVGSLSPTSSTSTPPYLNTPVTSVHVSPLVPRKVQESSLRVWIKKIYTGKPDRSTSAEEVLLMIETELAKPPILSVDPAIFQLEFLHLCAYSIYLHQPLTKPLRWVSPALLTNSSNLHTVADYLKALFFAWIDRAYPDPENFLEQPKNGVYRQDYEYYKIERFKSIIREHYPDKYEEDVLVICSMLATLYPFIKHNNGKIAYAICGYYSAIYETLHLRAPYPYVRLGGVLKGRYFLLDCHGFDMRGVDLSGTHLYGPSYEEITQTRLGISNKELLTYHINFQSADLRYANLSNTAFRMKESVLNTCMDATTNLIGSNIEQLNPRIEYVPPIHVHKPRTCISTGIKMGPPINFDDLED